MVGWGWGMGRESVVQVSLERDTYLTAQEEQQHFTGDKEPSSQMLLPVALEGRQAAPSHLHTHLEVLEFSSESLKTGDVLRSHLHDVAAGSRCRLVGNQELGIGTPEFIQEGPALLTP